MSYTKVVTMETVRASSPSGQKDFIGDRAGVEVIVGRYKVKRNVDLQIVPQEVIVFDGGGACMVGEPDVTFEADGLKCRTPVSQVPFLLEALENSGPYKGSQCIVFGGWMGFFYCLSFPARDALVAELKKIEPTVRQQAEEFERKVKERLAQAGVIDGRRPMPT